MHLVWRNDGFEFICLNQMTDTELTEEDIECLTEEKRREEAEEADRISLEEYSESLED